MSSSSSQDRSGSKFTETGVVDYERRRYRGVDQRIVHAREVRLLKKIFKIIRAANQIENSLVLDLPCGYGRFSDLLVRQGFLSINCDLSFHMVRSAEAKCGRAGVTANAVQGLPFQNGVFDVIFSIRFFHHLHLPRDRRAVLGEFCRVTSRWAIVTFYRMNGLHIFQRRIRRLLGKSRTNIAMIEPGRFEKEVAGAGFEIVKIYPLLRGIHAYHVALLQKKTNPEGREKA